MDLNTQADTMAVQLSNLNDKLPESSVRNMNRMHGEMELGIIDAYAARNFSEPKSSCASCAANADK